MLTGQFHTSLAEIAAERWDRLVACDQPFLRHAFLSGLESCGCIQEELGWRPHHLCLYDGSELVAAAPSYLKSNSHGEYVFDWAWAQAYARHDLAYYPKLVVTVPYLPATGPRLLVGAVSRARACTLRQCLRDALVHAVRESGLSGAHFLFLTDDDAASLAHDPLLPRFDWQFHWQNRGYRDFADFLDALTGRRRRAILRERQRVAQAGISFAHWHGHEIGSAQWAVLFRHYQSTFARKNNTPALTRAFFEHVSATMPESVVVIAALRGRKLIASAICFRSSDTLYGRYWGSDEEVPGLHFETCYYQGIAYCLEHGLKRFEPGAQGEHKLSRGFEPVRTRSAHYLAHPAFQVAVRLSLGREHQVLSAQGEELLARSPFRRPGAG